MHSSPSGSVRRCRVRVYIEELEGRALLSSVQRLPLSETAYSTNWSVYAAEIRLPASNAVTRSAVPNVPTVTGKANAYRRSAGWHRRLQLQLGRTARHGAGYFHLGKTTYYACGRCT